MASFRTKDKIYANNRTLEFSLGLTTNISKTHTLFFCISINKLSPNRTDATKILKTEVIRIVSSHDRSPFGKCVLDTNNMAFKTFPPFYNTSSKTLLIFVVL